MSAPDPVQFISLAVDPSGEVVCAGSLDPFNVYVFALQTGNLLDILSGHEGPVSCLQFDQASGHMASGSWDKTVKVWDVYRNEALETFHLPADVLCLAYRPDGKQMCVGTLQGQLHLWNVEDAVEEAVIDGQRDIAGGRGAEDKITAQASAMRRHFSTVTFSADGTCVLAGGRSKFVCIYETSQQVLLKKFQVSHNRSRDGVLDLLPSSMMSEAGPYASLNLDQGSDGEGGASTLLPGATRGADGKRGLTRKEVSVACVRFSATGREWAAATTDGLLVYALNEDLLFDPIDVDETLTPQAVSECLERGECSRALRMSLHLNDSSLIIRSMEAVDAGDIPLVLQSLSLTSHTSVGILCRLIHALAERIVHSRHLEFYLSWSLEILRIHSHTLKTDRPHIAAGGKGGVLSLSMSARLRSSLRELQRAVMRQQHILLTLCDDNQYTLSFLSSVQTVEPEEEQQTVQQQLDEKGSDRPSKEEPAGTEEDQVVAPADQEPKHIEEGTEHQEQSPVVSSKKRKPSSGKQQSQPGAAEKEDRSPQAKKMRKRRQKTPKTKGA